MDIVVFTLCDGAFNYGGRLSVIGTYDQLNVTSVPQAVRTSFAMKISFRREEIAPNSRIKVSFKDSQNNVVAIGIDNTLPVPPDGLSVLHIAVALNVEMNITSLGAHRVVLEINGDEIQSRPFIVGTATPQ